MAEPAGPYGRTEHRGSAPNLAAGHPRVCRDRPGFVDTLSRRFL